MATTFQVKPFHPMRILICFLLLAVVPPVPGHSLFDDQDGEENPVLVHVSIKSVIRGVRDAVEINGRLVTNYSPTMVYELSSTGIAIDHDHVMAFLGYDRWIDIKSTNPQVEISSSEGQTWKGELIGVDKRNGVAVVRLLDGKLKKTPVCPQCNVEGGATIMAPVVEGSNLSRYRTAQILSVGTWPGIPKQAGWMMAMNQAFPGVNLPILTTDHRVLGLIASQDPMGRQTLVYPISELLSSAKEILKVKGDIHAGWLGVFPEDLRTSKNPGLLIRAVEPDSPAQRAGLRPGDLLIKYRGQQIRDSRQFVYLVEGTPIGSKANLEIIRQGNPMTVEAAIAVRKSQPNPMRLSINFPGAFGSPAPVGFPDPKASGPYPSRAYVGLDTILLTPSLADAMQMPGQTGLLVVDVVKQMPADLAGVRPADVITSVDGRPIVDPLGFASYMATRDWSAPLDLTVLRKGTELTISVQVPDEGR